MKILFLAPQPFFTERGTPIAVDLVLRALSERGDVVDVVTYPMGKDVHYPNIRLHRVAQLPFIQDISPGFSVKKVFYDILLFFMAMKLVLRNRYHLVHAVEESVFIAVVIKILFKVPYVYDMDSSLANQMLERFPFLERPLSRILHYFEGAAVRRAKAVVPVCDALQQDIERFEPEKVVLLRDVSLLNSDGTFETEDLRSTLGITGPIMMYVGNLESYQGIDLLLESFALAQRKKGQASLVVIGGKTSSIEKYKAMAKKFGIQKQVYFLGPKPVGSLAGYLSQADILVSPRIKGNNTPMKIYSYLDSGKALLATRLPTHTQVLNSQVAMLADPSPEDFSAGVLRLAEDRRLRARLGQAGKQLIAERHTYQVFRTSLDILYDWLTAEISPPSSDQAAPGSDLVKVDRR